MVDCDGSIHIVHNFSASLPDRSLHPGTCMRVVCRHRCIITDKVSSHRTIRCRLNLSRVFHYQSVSKPQIPPKVVPPNRTKSFQSRIFRSGCPIVRALSDASARIAQVVRGLLRSEKDGLSRVPWGVFDSSLPPSGAAVY